MDKKYDIVGRELKEKDKVVFLWRYNGNMRPQRAYITRFSEKCAFVCLSTMMKFWEEEKNKKDKRKWEIKTTNTTKSIFKHNWEKQWIF